MITLIAIYVIWPKLWDVALAIQLLHNPPIATIRLYTVSSFMACPCWNESGIGKKTVAISESFAEMNSAQQTKKPDYHPSSCRGDTACPGKSEERWRTLVVGKNFWLTTHSNWILNLMLYPVVVLLVWAWLCSLFIIIQYILTEDKPNYMHPTCKPHTMNWLHELLNN